MRTKIWKVFILKFQQRNGDDSSDDEWSRGEKARKQDLKERDDFANRINKKDKENTRKIVKAKKVSDGCGGCGGCGVSK